MGVQVGKKSVEVQAMATLNSVNVSNVTDSFVLELRFVDYGCYLPPDVDYAVGDPISIAINCIGIVIILFLGMSATLQFMKMTKMNRWLVTLFTSCIMFAAVTLLSILINFSICIDRRNQLMSNT